jgi:pimeloyl-ACP methyl ester carboxylesterase
MVVFKDGFVVTGKLTREGGTITDSFSGQTFHVSKGSFFINDGARHVSFSHRLVQDVDKKDGQANADLIAFGMRVSRLNSMVMDPVLNVAKVSPWDKRWERDVTIRTVQYGKPFKYAIHQRLAWLTPQWVRADALRYHWSAYYLTNELGVEEVRKLLAAHPDLRMKGDASDAAKRFRVARFYTQAGWYDEADKEYAAILKSFPAEKEQVTQSRDHLKGLRQLQQVELIERANQARQHLRCQSLLANFPRDGVDEALQTRVRTLRAKYATSNETLKQAGGFLERFGTQAGDSRLKEAAAVILEELNHDNVNRLEAFLGLSKQAERDRRQGGKTDKGPEQLLALAVSGWLLGKDAADAKVDNALRLWDGRRFVLQYLKTDDADDRDKLLQAYQKKTDGQLAFDELAQLIPTLPPLSPEKLKGGTTPLELKTADYSGKRDGLRYLLQLPPEYHPGRAYPVVIALHQVGEGPKEMLQRCGYQAALHGYLLAAPAWPDPLARNYGFAPEEHAAVLNTLWDLRRRFAVDSDRVFLLGVGEGGTMAYDVGLSHPDCFAGVVPVSAGLRMFSQRYAQAGCNGQFLPFYAVNGTQAGELSKQNRDLFDRDWVPNGYPSLHVEYGGRGLEWFAWEQLPMFDWMDRKKRATAFPSLGGRKDFVTMRPTDNHFYWVSTEELRPNNVNDHRAWSNRTIAASLSARILEGNQISLTTRGVRRLTVWLGRDAQGRDMIDFTKPVTIRSNGAVVVNRKAVKPSLETLLGDLYKRGDRQRLFFVKERIELR